MVTSAMALSVGSQEAQAQCTVDGTSSVSATVPVLENLLVTGQGRYLGLFLDGYTEAGRAGAISVDDRDIHLLPLRGQVDVPKAMNGLDGEAIITPFRGAAVHNGSGRSLLLAKLRKVKVLY